MKKIPTLFMRGADRRYVTDEVTPGCEWVLAGEGVATRKYDGTCMMLDEANKWWARREVKPGKNPPENYVVDNVDEVTGKTQGWEPIEQSPFVKFHSEAIEFMFSADGDGNDGPGTYELVGPKINGNPELVERTMLIAHFRAETITIPLIGPKLAKKTVTDLYWWGWEGIVWHHPDGRMAKLKARDLPDGGES